MKGVRPALPIDGVAVILGNKLSGGRVWAVGSSSSVSGTADGPGAQPHVEGDQVPEVHSVSAITRSASRVWTEPADPDSRASTIVMGLPTSISRSRLIQEQFSDSSLQPLFGKARLFVDGDLAPGYVVKDGILMRRCLPRNNVRPDDPVWQVAVPSALRQLVMKTAHDDAGHMGVKKTYDRVIRLCYWPRLKRDIVTYVRTCHICQLTGKPNQMPKPVPLRPIPAVAKPFEHLVIDCVGPLPRSKTGCSYLLTVICQTTRYPAAYPLRSITAKSVIKALSQFISIFGLPKVIQSDRGTNFTSQTFAQHTAPIEHPA